MSNARYPITDWKNEVANNGTNLGYWDWVLHKLVSAGASAREIKKARLLSTDEIPRRCERTTSPYDNVWGEHATHTRKDWGDSVISLGSQSGYWAWVATQIDEALEEGELSEEEFKRDIGEIAHFLPHSAS